MIQRVPDPDDEFLDFPPSTDRLPAPLPPKAEGPAEPSSDVKSLVGEFRTYLQRTILQDTIVHEQTIPSTPERVALKTSHLGPEVERVLSAAGIEHLWSHQEEGIHLLREGKDVVVATPTASGKTLVYNAAVLADLLLNPSGCAIYIFPLKAPEQDQLDAMITQHLCHC